MEEGTQQADAPVARPGRPRHAKAPTRGRRWLFETVTVVLVAVVVAVLLRTFIVATYSIPSASMEPTLNIGDRILVDKLSYELHGIGRGNIIVFATPSNEHCAGPPVPDLVKRVIGLAGDTLSLSNGLVYVNGTALSQPWLPAVTRHQTTAGPGAQPYALVQPYKVPKGDVFVMGDNRTQSCDSRYWGPIPTSSIVGQVDIRIWPVSRLHLF